LNVSTDLPFAPPLRAFAGGRYLFVLACVAVACGALGAGFTFVLRGVERLAFGFTTGTLAEAISGVDALHRFLAVAIGGVFVAAAWYALRRIGPRIPSVDEIAQGATVRPLWMVADTILQVINVGVGASIGREGAPRQAGALTGALGAERLGLSVAMRRVVVACGAGAGLAAIYNVPFGGACFALEVVLGLGYVGRARSAAVGIVGSTLACAWIATIIARVAVADRPTYTLDQQTWVPALLLFALVVGPVLGAAGYGFGSLVERARGHAAQGGQLLWRMPLGYVLLGLLAIPFPLILGNGHAMAQNIFAATVPLGMAVALAIAKPVATLVTILAGATGGRLTPSLATGAAMGLVLAAITGSVVPILPATAATLGAAAFLAGATRAPLTAGILAIEFTGGTSIWMPVAIVVGSAWAVTAALELRRRGPWGS
jgi:CIC family chloride channel protein